MIRERLADPRRPRQRASGLSLVELVIFIVIVSAALAGVLTVFITATTSSADPLLRRQALAIAESVLEEVQLMPFTFCDPDDANVESAAKSADCASQAEGLGRELGEGRFRVPQFDNVNDYDGYEMTGIVDITESKVEGLEGYSVKVVVAKAALAKGLTREITEDSGDALRITVSVTGPGATKISLDGYRTRYAPNATL